MNISYNWLKDLIDIGLSPEELGKKLTNVGLAVEGIHAHGDDFVFDIDLTSNRPDCLSHLGVAREIGVIAGQNLKDVSNFQSSPPDPSNPLATIEDSELCSRFTARIIRDVQIGPSPKWLVDRLEAIGERSINNVADITNYVMHELGQPMHAFDLDKLTGNRLVVRRAANGESIETLDEIKRQLDNTILAICDSEKPVAVAGVMGGIGSSITDTTTNVLLEVAFFKRSNIRATSRKFNLATEASYRFERGVDIENLEPASNRAAALIQEFAGGRIDEFVDIYPTKPEQITAESTDISAAVKRLTGLKVDASECLRILNALGICEKNTAQSGTKIFIVPSWRHDIVIEEDLVEEIARHVGFENIAAELPPAFGAGEYQETESREKRLRQTLTTLGFDEAISYSFIDTKYDDVFAVIPGLTSETDDNKFITLRDSVIDGAVRMRQSVLPGLLDAVRLNFNHQRKDLRLFELGKVFAAQKGVDNLPNEQKSFALIISGGETQAERALPARILDFYDVKGYVESALSAVDVKNLTFDPADVEHLRRGQAAQINLNGQPIGYVGRLSDEIAAKYKFRQPVYAAELNLSVVLHQQPENVIYRPLAKYPAVVRDVSFIVDRKLQFADIAAAITAQQFDLCTSATFVDIYEGKGLADDERSVTVRLEYRSDARTLVEDEVEVMHKQIVSQVVDRLSVKVRH